jgi:hypothetical protein
MVCHKKDKDQFFCNLMYEQEEAQHLFLEIQSLSLQETQYKDLLPQGR